jgi:hypothetical protein
MVRPPMVNTTPATDIVYRRAKPYARQFVVFVFVFVILLVAAFAVPSTRSWRESFCYLIPFALVYAAYLATALLRAGSDSVPAGPLWAGICFIAGGASLDVAGTLANTPKLTQEANRIARALLDSGHSLSFVYMYAAIGQTLAILLYCLLWAAFLRHRTALLALGVQANLRGGWDFLKAATGGARLSWRQFLFPMRISDLPDAYPIAMMLAVLLAGSSLSRWYWGLYWLGVLPWLSDVTVSVATVLLATVAYFAWLWMRWLDLRGR